jgi:hypothetical protein
MPKIPGVNHIRAVKALEKAGFRIVRQGKNILLCRMVQGFFRFPAITPLMPIPWAALFAMPGFQQINFKNYYKFK